MVQKESDSCERLARGVSSCVAFAIAVALSTGCTGLAPRSFGGNEADGGAPTDAGMDAGEDAGDAGDAADAGDGGGVDDAGLDAGTSDAGGETADGGDGGGVAPDAGDAGGEGVDAGLDAGPDAGIDAGPDAGADGGEDSGVDAGPDGGDAGPPYNWLITQGNGADEVAVAVAVDPIGYVYVTGYTTGFLFSTPLGGLRDFFVAKYAPDGTRVWGRQYGTSQDDFARGIAVGGTLYPYVTGKTGSKAFVWKLNSSDGSSLWQSNISTASDQSGVAIGFDTFPGNVYVAGEAYGLLADGGVPSNDIFLARFDQNGMRQWLVPYGSPAHDYVGGLAVSTMSRSLGGGQLASLVYEIFVIGTAFDALPGVDGGAGPFIAEFDSDGGKGWTLRVGPSNGYGRAIGIREVPNNNPIMFALIDSSSYAPGFVIMGGSDVYLVRIDSNLSITNIHAFQSNANEWGAGLTVDGEGNVHIVGTTEGAVETGSPNDGSADAFIARVDYQSGTVAWIRQIGSSSTVFGNAVAAFPGGDAGVFVGGFSGAAFEGHASDGGSDYYLKRFSFNGGF